ncbi:MAG: L-serine ammonia-lyase [Actinomycetaceae bacterium]|nr:L-serine ammonia-lyase [Actinomycetaceae bacterium]
MSAAEGDTPAVDRVAEASPAGLISGHTKPAKLARPLSVFDLFRIGIGPSSSHTVGPMRAAHAFAAELQHKGMSPRAIRVTLYGSLGATGRGHSTDRAIILGLAGYEPQTVSANVISSIVDLVHRTGKLTVAGGTQVPFTMDDIKFAPMTVLPYHVNALTIDARIDNGNLCRTYYSVGGGFIMEDRSPDPATPDVIALATPDARKTHATPAPFPFSTAAELVDLCERENLSVADLMRANEETAHDRTAVNEYLDLIQRTMAQCVDAGCATEGVLPGGLNVARRAPALAARLSGRAFKAASADVWAGTVEDPLRAMDWVNLFALAVNEENAAGQRVVTAPTNGAAGVIPAVLGYLLKFCPEGRNAPVHAARDFLLAATAIGALIKTNASIAGAEVGCQGEIGSASAMAAAGLAQTFGGSARQVENAAEIAMEHSLGLTCDPIGGLVQIPCIERNAIAAVKAINAARMAMWGDGRHTVPLDAAIQTMWQTGRDMLSKYKETSAGGLAVNVVEC